MSSWFYALYLSQLQWAGHWDRFVCGDWACMLTFSGWGPLKGSWGEAVIRHAQIGGCCLALTIRWQGESASGWCPADPPLELPPLGSSLPQAGRLGGGFIRQHVDCLILDLSLYCASAPWFIANKVVAIFLQKVSLLFCFYFYMP